MIEYTGSIARVRYYSEETKYIVAVFDSHEEDKPFVITGHMVYDLESQYKIQGDYVNHPKYGKQFQLSGYEKMLADGRESIIRYLSSSLFKGIGEKQATHIVDTLGEDCLTIIQEDPSSLTLVEGMTDKKIQVILDVLQNEAYDQKLLSFFMGHGISTRNLALIQAVYEENTLEVIQNNPYQLIEDIEGIGFKSADSLAMKLGIDPRDPHRLKAAIQYGLMEACFQSGSTSRSLADIMRYTRKYVQITDEEIMTYLQELIDDHQIVYEEERFYTYDLYHSEIVISNFFDRFTRKEENIDISLLEKRIQEVEQTLSIHYDDIQKQAIEFFLKNQAMILTGGPGTGKTTIVRGILKVYRAFYPESKIDLVAPTGRAAKRLSELTGLEASTIHRLLKWDLHTNTYGMNRENPLDTRLLVIDESSMVDSLLFSKLLEAGTHINKILLIGDDCQLPSVSPGNVLHDLIESQSIPTIRLNHIYRQQNGSGIVELAHDIRNNQFNELIFNDYPSIHFIECQNLEVIKYTLSIVQDKINEGYDEKDIQVLSPMYNGVAGIDALNEALRNLFNPQDLYKDELNVGMKTYRQYDKILQLKNRVDDNIFNGDIGTIIEINDSNEDTVIADFDGTIVSFDKNELNQMTHAYAMSIHKSQGNEFSIVIMPILSDFNIMNRKNLLYTGLTRAKKELYLLGSREVFKRSLQKIGDNRETTLKQRLLKPMSIEDFE